MSEPVILDPSSTAALRSAFGAVPTSVAVITAYQNNEPVGISVGSFGSISLDPPLVGFFIASTSTTWPRILPSGGFAASILSAPQEAVSRVFATRGADKFAVGSWTRSLAGRPVLQGASAWFDCTIDSIVPAGDHDLVLGRVDRMAAAPDADPLIFLGGGYGRLSRFSADSSSQGTP